MNYFLIIFLINLAFLIKMSKKDIDTFLIENYFPLSLLIINLGYGLIFGINYEIFAISSAIALFFNRLGWGFADFLVILAISPLFDNWIQVAFFYFISVMAVFYYMFFTKKKQVAYVPFITLGFLIIYGFKLLLELIAVRP